MAWEAGCWQSPQPSAGARPAVLSAAPSSAPSRGRWGGTEPVSQTQRVSDDRGRSPRCHLIVPLTAILPGAGSFCSQDGGGPSVPTHSSRGSPACSCELACRPCSARCHLPRSQTGGRPPARAEWPSWPRRWTWQLTPWLLQPLPVGEARMPRGRNSTCPAARWGGSRPGELPWSPF